jgi:hypothetical protein
VRRRSPVPGRRVAGLDATVSAGPRVLLMRLSERTSGKGNRYLSGWLGKASVVAFQAEEPDKWGNPVWDVFVSTPEPRAEAGQARSERRPQSPDHGDGRVSTSATAAKPPARPQERGDGWRGSQYRRPMNERSQAPVADDAPFYEDSLEDVGR